MNYLVTGGTGFVGAYAVKALVEAGHRVTVFDLMLNREYLADVLGGQKADEVQLISGDVTDLPAVLRAMRSAEAQRVVHLAATLSAGSEVNPLRTLKVNCEGTL
ncbi:MAG: GDP-mannose 4,6-dehydratase, partial [Candidatus Tectomicrobia bacterium]|nr:GDP-mannose 4,6-dehydratase [Candidatus Tectomicrobia bacterium]